ncbi:hypothetical protein A2U01_0025203, partial [Trifolium medium]|nr:hypothetical protein [Trifolium medium]
MKNQTPTSTPTKSEGSNLKPNIESASLIVQATPISTVSTRASKKGRTKYVASRKKNLSK